MNYNFDEIIERCGTGCEKWDATPPYAANSKSEAGNDMLPMWVADMDFAVAPAIADAVARRAQHPIYGYTHISSEYYDAVQRWFARRHHWTIEREWMLYTTGVVPALSATIKALTMPGERVILMTPVYNCFFSSLRNNGCEMAEVPLNVSENGTTCPMDVLESQCADERTTLLVLCNPHNPVGHVWSREELETISAICHRHSVQIVSDEIHCELVYRGRYVPMGTIDDSAVILTSASKSFNIAGLQMANIVAKDPVVRHRINRAININEICDVNPFGPVATIAAYNDSEEWLDALLEYLEGNFTALCKYISSEMPGLRVMPLEGTYLVWVDITSTGMKSNALQRCLLETSGLWVSSGTIYGRPSGEGYLRINIACPRSMMMEGLERMKRVIDNL